MRRPGARALHGQFLPGRRWPNLKLKRVQVKAAGAGIVNEPWRCPREPATGDVVERVHLMALERAHSI